MTEGREERCGAVLAKLLHHPDGRGRRLGFPLPAPVALSRLRRVTPNSPRPSSRSSVYLRVNSTELLVDLFPQN
jgi:hypothetical protein